VNQSVISSSEFADTNMVNGLRLKKINDYITNKYNKDSTDNIKKSFIEKFNNKFNAKK